MSPFVSGFFHFIYFQGSFMLYVLVLYSFLWLNFISYGCTGHILFICSSCDGNKDCFHFLAIMNNAVMNICLQVFV